MKCNECQWYRQFGAGFEACSGVKPPTVEHKCKAGEIKNKETKEN